MGLGSLTDHFFDQLVAVALVPLLLAVRWLLWESPARNDEAFCIGASNPRIKWFFAGILAHFADKPN